MKIKGLIWLEEIVEKIDRKHGVSQEDVREILAGKPRFRFVEKGHRRNENVYAALGANRAGRHLVVFFILKVGGQALILSVRDMSKAERKEHEQK